MPLLAMSSPGIRALVGDKLVAGVAQVMKMNARQPGHFEGRQPDTTSEVRMCQRRAGMAGEDKCSTTAKPSTTCKKPSG
jgi:hypothetical protein